MRSVIILLAIFCAACAKPESGERDQSRPNILLLTAEDLSPRIASFGDPVALTPNIDALARQGVRYPNTFTTAGVCAPSRAALITGVRQTALSAQHMRANGLRNFRAVPPPEVKAFPELLRAAGYYTFTTGKLDYQFSLPFVGTGPGTIWNEESMGTIDLALLPRDRPFYGQMNFGVTHESQIFPIAWPRSWAAAFLLPGRIWNALWHEDVIDPETVPVPPYYPDTPTVRRDITRHYENIRIMDREVGDILEELEDAGLAESTIVLWTTDHGDGLPRAKRELFDSGLRVPLIIRWPERFRPPGVEAGSIDERLVSFVDLSATILSMAGVATPEWMDGRVFAGSDTDPPRKYIFAARDRLDAFPDRQRAVRDGRWKYIRNYRPGTPGAEHLAFRDHQEIMQELWTLLEAGELDPVQRRWFEARPGEELYDTEADPHEIDNVAGDPAHRATLERLGSALDTWIEARPDLGAMPEEEMIEMLWPGGKRPKTPVPEIETTPTASGRLLVRIESETEGASIRYRTVDGTGNTGSWELYVHPFEVPEGFAIEAHAIRYGWQESPLAISLTQ